MFYPKVRYAGQGGVIEVKGRAIGRLGAWKVQYYGDDKPFFSARDCVIPQLWVSAGVVALVVRAAVPPPRPGQPAPKPFIISGTVARITRDALSLGDLTIERAGE
jgi:hypothetical protein